MHENSLKARLASLILRETAMLFDHLSTWSYLSFNDPDGYRPLLRRFSAAPETTDEEVRTKQSLLMQFLPCEEESYAMHETASMILQICEALGDDCMDGRSDLLLAKHDLNLFIKAVEFCCPNLEPSWARDREKQETAHHWRTGEVL